MCVLCPQFKDSSLRSRELSETERCGLFFSCRKDYIRVNIWRTKTKNKREQSWLNVTSSFREPVLPVARRAIWSNCENLKELRTCARKCRRQSEKCIWQFQRQIALMIFFCIYCARAIGPRTFAKESLLATKSAIEFRTRAHYFLLPSLKLFHLIRFLS